MPIAEVPLNNVRENAESMKLEVLVGSRTEKPKLPMAVPRLRCAKTE